MRRLLFLLLDVVLVCGAAGPVLAQPTPDVHVPPVEITTSISFDLQRKGTADLPGGVGTVVGFDGNLNDHVAVATELSDSPRMRSVMAGARVSTGYYYDGPGGPARFFAEALAGAHQPPAGTSGATILLGGGADVLVVRRGVSLHWALDYLFFPDAPHDFAGGRFSIGIVVGPRIARSSRGA